MMPCGSGATCVNLGLGHRTPLELHGGTAMHCPSAAPARTCRVAAPGRRGGCFRSGDGGCFTGAHARALLQAQHVLGMHGWAPGRQGGPATRGRASPRSSPATSSSGNAGGAGSHASAAARSSPSCRPCTLRRKHTCPPRPRSSPVSGLGWWHAPPEAAARGSVRPHAWDTGSVARVRVRFRGAKTQACVSGKEGAACEAAYTKIPQRPAPLLRPTLHAGFDPKKTKNTQ